MVVAARLAWVKLELARGRQARIKMSSFLGKVKLTLVLLPQWHDGMMNLPAIAMIDLFLERLHGVIAVDHGHANSAGESHISICMMPAPLVALAAAQGVVEEIAGDASDGDGDAVVEPHFDGEPDYDVGPYCDGEPEYDVESASSPTATLARHARTRPVGEYTWTPLVPSVPPAQAAAEAFFAAVAPQPPSVPPPPQAPAVAPQPPPPPQAPPPQAPPWDLQVRVKYREEDYGIIAAADDLEMDRLLELAMLEADEIEVDDIDDLVGIINGRRLRYGMVRGNVGALRTTAGLARGTEVVLTLELVGARS